MHRVAIDVSGEEKLSPARARDKRRPEGEDEDERKKPEVGRIEHAGGDDEARELGAVREDARNAVRPAILTRIPGPGARRLDILRQPLTTIRAVAIAGQSPKPSSK